LSDKMSRKKNHCIALTDKFSIIAAHHCIYLNIYKNYYNILQID
jgi:hypothetical protein